MKPWKRFAAWVIAGVALISGGAIFKKHYAYAEVINFGSMPVGFKHCIIGDTGSLYDVQKETSTVLLRENCDHLSFTGDIIYEDGLYSHKDPNFQKRFYNFYGKICSKIPCSVTLGNHDHAGKATAWLKIAKKYPIHFPNMYYMQRYEDICFFFLDTQFFKEKSKGQYKKQVDWFKKVSIDPSCTFKMVIGHHPMYSSGEHGSAEYSRMDAYKNYVEGKIDAMIAGHDHHLEYYGKISGTHHIISGAGGKLRSTEMNGPFAKSIGGYVTMEYLGDQKFKTKFIGTKDAKRTVEYVTIIE